MSDTKDSVEKNSPGVDILNFGMRPSPFAKHFDWKFDWKSIHRCRQNSPFVNAKHFCIKFVQKTLAKGPNGKYFV